MTAPVMDDTVVAPVVTGDGTTAGSRTARRWHRARWAVLVLAVLALVVTVLAISRPPSSTTAYAPDNAQPTGARATAQVLEHQGVEIEHVTRVADAVAAAGPGTTLLVTPSPYMLPEQADALATAGADLVLAGAGDDLVRTVSEGAVSRTPVGDPVGPVAPRCDLPVARAAGDLTLASGLRAATGASSDVTLCWPGDDGAGLAQVAVRPALDGGGVPGDVRPVTLVDDPSFLRNDAVLDDGNAALALGLLGGHERLVWLVQDPLDITTTREDDDPSAPTGSLLPPWAGTVGLWALLVALVAAVWRGRRLGAVVPETLPVVVRASETTRGRGRLYRRARSRGHAAAGLRAAAAERVARRLGVPRSADATALTDAVGRATGRPPQEVVDLLYGPPPADDEALTALARRLDILESEVHRS
ncbi:DUF4350 domain-containing protein [Isoptericola cucumis]|uniref:DUF4350 domain-containing protein n=1 Tax=Isoptericola cucumis TaxID=1776856 RepID=A0ABQ2B9K2_9MICO|nr:DUF4350 domain-containing protein [Isoptericola cucumis]GGI08726.1 hypothetical protein GCM10007368_22600 [Isoptericola cucumis]